MIIIKISIRHFIESTHTDDFHSTGTRLVLLKRGEPTRRLIADFDALKECA